MINDGIIFDNRILDIVFLSTVTAQIIKIFLPVFKLKKPNFSKIFETGGMPSSHSSSVATLCTCIAILYGTTSAYFAISVVVSAVVMYDATGIRREAGKHARALNELYKKNVDIFKSKEFVSFKEFLGHSPFEVLVGCLLGIAIAIIFRGYIS